MTMRNDQVAFRWSEGKAATNHEGTFWTDGKKLYSYKLQIGDTADELKILRLYTANGRHGFKSQTTSQHVGKAKAYADILD